MSSGSCSAERDKMGNAQHGQWGKWGSKVITIVLSAHPKTKERSSMRGKPGAANEYENTGTKATVVH